MNAAMTSWIPYSALGYSGTAISGIGGSSLAGMGGGGVTGDYVEKSATEVAIGPGSTALKIAFAQGDNCSASSTSFAQGYDNSARLNSFAQGIHNTASNDSFAQGSSNTATSNSLAQGIRNSAYAGSFAQGSWNSASSYSFAQGYNNSAQSNSFAQGGSNSASSYSFAQGFSNSATNASFAQGIRNSAVYTATVFGSYNLHGNGNTASGDSAAFAIGDGTANTARHDLMLVTKNGEITMYSSTADTVGLGLVSSIKAISAAATGGVDSATVSAIASAYTTGKQDTLAFAYNTADQISSINGSALGGMDEAAVSGIASAYAQSAASGKLDTTAFNSADFYSTSNPSGFITGVDLTPYQPTSAMSAYATTAYVESGLSGKENVFSAGTGLEFVQSGSDRVLQVETPVDIVAGPGIVIDNPDGNTLRVSMAQNEEVTLWSGSCLRQSSQAVSLSESASNFEKIEIYAVPNPSESFINSPQIFTYPGSNTAGAYICPFMTTELKGKFGCGLWTITNGTSFKLVAAGQTDAYPSQNWDNAYGGVVKIVGIHRTASN